MENWNFRNIFCLYKKCPLTFSHMYICVYTFFKDLSLVLYIYTHKKQAIYKFMKIGSKLNTVMIYFHSNVYIFVPHYFNWNNNKQSLYCQILHLLLCACHFYFTSYICNLVSSNDIFRSLVMYLYQNSTTARDLHSQNYH